MNHPYRLTPTAAAVLAFAGAAALAMLLMPFAASASTAAPAATTDSVSSHPNQGPTVDRILRAMRNASTWGHPDQFYEYSGMQAYSQGHYADAIKYFKYGARYADKFSQLAVGLMYENGRGVKQDSVEACAWLALAAQAKAPGFTATRDRVCKALTPSQHDAAVAKLDKLLPVYGDKAAQRHMATALNLGTMQTTGSRLGFDSGIWNVPPTELPFTDGGAPYPDANCAGPALVGAARVPIAGCGSTDFWVAARWNPKQYFKLRHEHWLGTIIVGALQNLDVPASTVKAKATPSTSPGH